MRYIILCPSYSLNILYKEVSFFTLSEITTFKAGEKVMYP